MGDLSPHDRDEAARRLAALMPLAEQEAAAGRGAPIVPVLRTLLAARALAEGGGRGVILHNMGAGWSAELVIETDEGTKSTRTDPQSAVDQAAAEAAALRLVAGLLSLNLPPGAPNTFTLGSTVYPINAAALESARRAAETIARSRPEGYDHAQAHVAILDEMLADVFPDGFSVEAFELLLPRRQQLIVGLVYDSAVLGMVRYPLH